MGTRAGRGPPAAQNGARAGSGDDSAADRGQGRLVVADHAPRAASTRPGSTRWSTRSPRSRRRGRRSSWSPPARSPPGWRRSDCPPAAGPGHPAGRRERRPGAAGRAATPSPFARHGRTVGQVLLTVDDVIRRAHYRNAQRTLAKLLDARRGADRQRERHGRHRGDPLRRQRPARRAGRRTWSTPTCWSCSPTSTPSTTGDPPAARQRAGSPRCAAARGPGRRRHRRRRARRGRHRRHGHQGRGGPDRHRRRHPGGADRRAARRATRWPASDVGTLFHPAARRPGRPAVLAGARHHAARAGCTSTPARCRRSSSGASRCCRPGSPRVDGDFDAGDPVDLVDADGRAGGPRAGQLRRGGAARPARPLHPASCAADPRPGATRREVVHRDDLVTAVSHDEASDRRQERRTHERRPEQVAGAARDGGRPSLAHRCRGRPRTRALLAMADALLARTAGDPRRQRRRTWRPARAQRHCPSRMVDRLRLDAARVDAMADGLRELAGLPDPVGEVVRGSTLPNGLELRQVRVPLGVVGIIYEARPNVTVDAAGICLKSRQRGPAARLVLGVRTPTPRWWRSCATRWPAPGCPPTRCSCVPRPTATRSRS